MSKKDMKSKKMLDVSGGAGTTYNKTRIAKAAAAGAWDERENGAQAFLDGAIDGAAKDIAKQKVEQTLSGWFK